ncbi:hypothetical protein GCM10027590_62640 [Nocardiopsis nanhaiensis]
MSITRALPWPVRPGSVPGTCLRWAWFDRGGTRRPAATRRTGTGAATVSAPRQDTVSCGAQLRHCHPCAATRGMPLPATCPSQPYRRWVSEADLATDNGCLPPGRPLWPGRGGSGQDPAPGGDAG